MTNTTESSSPSNRSLSTSRGSGRNHRHEQNNDSKSIEVEQVGFSSLPEQVHRKSIKKGFEFTILIIGDSGLGKSTLINSLFMTDLYSDRVLDTVTDRVKKTVTITKRAAELEEKGVRLKLTVVDTPGFGDSINAQNCWKPIVDYVENQFYSYFVHESGYGVDRKKMQDNRVHCCLYFLPPHVRGLRPIDIETIRYLQDKVNIVPVIGKADSLTKKEIETLKQNILNDIEKYQLKLYEFPQCDSDDDETFKKMDNEIKSAIPFALIGSNTVMESGNKRIRGRVYPWGIVDIESDVCDFDKLRTFICSSHMQDLKDLTHDVHYENYRTELIKSQQNGNNKSFNRNHNSSSVSRNNQDETEKLLKQKELELRRMHELLTQMKLSQETSNNSVPKQTPSQPINSHNYVNVQANCSSVMNQKTYENTTLNISQHHHQSSNGHHHFNHPAQQFHQQVQNNVNGKSNGNGNVNYYHAQQYQPSKPSSNNYVNGNGGPGAMSTFILNTNNNFLLNRTLNSPIAINTNGYEYTPSSNTKSMNGNGMSNYSNSTPI